MPSLLPAHCPHPFPRRLRAGDRRRLLPLYRPHPRGGVRGVWLDFAVRPGPGLVRLLHLRCWIRPRLHRRLPAGGLPHNHLAGGRGGQRGRRRPASTQVPACSRLLRRDWCTSWASQPSPKLQPAPPACHTPLPPYSAPLRARTPRPAWALSATAAAARSGEWGAARLLTTHATARQAGESTAMLAPPVGRPERCAPLACPPSIVGCSVCSIAAAQPSLRMLNAPCPPAAHSAPGYGPLTRDKRCPPNTCDKDHDATVCKCELLSRHGASQSPARGQCMEGEQHAL